MIPANAYIVFNQRDHFGVNASDPGVIEGFGLSEHGESIFLTSGEQGAITGEYSVFETFGATINGVTVGRHRLSDTLDSSFDFVQLEASTLGGSNALQSFPKSSLKKFAITLSMKAMHFMNTSSCLIGAVKRFIYMTLTIRQIHGNSQMVLSILSLKELQFHLGDIF